MDETNTKIEIKTIMQFDDCNDLVPTIEDCTKYGFISGDKVIVTIQKIQ